ncbi:MAG: phosphoribosylformylglycinamidine synthase subunit PurQ [Bacteroidetes bacterium]|nr:phosphoribosylformylglycinamidine synthase subunit PurQ [Bacteroidota bacterium]
MKFGVIIFPGSNCDRDIIHVLEDVLQQKVEILWHKDHDLKGLGSGDCIIVPGGFSYGDYLRPGAIARFSPVMNEVIEFAKNGGFVWGICNGFQVLCECHLLPGALVVNDSRKFVCQNQYITPVTTDSAITSGLETGKAYNIPIAHADGRFIAGEDVLADMKANNQVLFKYCGPEGEVNTEFNPNGSLDNIAGICNKERNVFGMMPHPERASEEILRNTDGRALFESLLSLVTV